MNIFKKDYKTEVDDHPFQKKFEKLNYIIDRFKLKLMVCLFQFTFQRTIIFL